MLIICILFTDILLEVLKIAPGKGHICQAQNKRWNKRIIFKSECKIATDNEKYTENKDNKKQL